MQGLRPSGKPHTLFQFIVAGYVWSSGGTNQKYGEMEVWGT
jgi:hypothetical protein